MMGKPEGKIIVGKRCTFVHDTSVNGQPMRRSKVKGTVLVIINPEGGTSSIVLIFLRRRIKDCGQPDRRELLYSSQYLNG